MSQPKETKYRATCGVSEPHKISRSAAQTLKSSDDLSSCGFYPTSQLAQQAHGDPVSRASVDLYHSSYKTCAFLLVLPLDVCKPSFDLL